jgi:hypothetical protein
MQDHSERKLTAQRGRDAPVKISEVFIGAPDQAFKSVRANWKSALVMMMTSGKSSRCGTSIIILRHSQTRKRV